MEDEETRGKYRRTEHGGEEDGGGEEEMALHAERLVREEVLFDDLLWDQGIFCCFQARHISYLSTHEQFQR